MAASRALDVSVIPLCGEDTLWIESCQLELRVHIGGDHEVVAVARPFEKPAVERCRAGLEPVHPDVLRPVGPLVLLCGEGVEPRRVHIGHAVALDEGREVPLAALSGIREPGGSGQPRARPDKHAVCVGEQRMRSVDVVACCHKSLLAVFERMRDAVIGWRSGSSALQSPPSNGITMPAVQKVAFA